MKNIDIDLSQFKLIDGNYIKSKNFDSFLSDTPDRFISDDKQWIICENDVFLPEDLLIEYSIDLKENDVNINVKKVYLDEQEVLFDKKLVEQFVKNII